MKKVTILIFSFLLIIFYAYNAYGQNSKITIEWQKEYQLKIGRPVNIAYDAIVLDNSYLIAGMSGSKDGKGNIFLLKVNHTGEKLWSKLYNAKKNQIATSIVSNKDQCIVGGLISENLLVNKYSRSYLMIIDDSKNKVFEKIIKLKYKSSIISLKKVDNNVFIIGGYIINNKKYFNQYLVKINSSGSEVWKKVYYEDQNRFLKKIIIDNGNILIGGFLSIDNQNAKAYLVKIDKDGKKKWERHYGDKGIYMTTTIVEDINSYIMGGNIINQENGVFICKFSKDGEQIWSKNYYNKELNTINNIYNSNENYIVIGQNKNNNIYAMKIDKNGTKLWKETINNNKLQIPTKILKISDSSYLIIGYNESQFDKQNSNNNIFLLKINIPL